jgi:hypothetical protein
MAVLVYSLGSLAFATAVTAITAGSSVAVNVNNRTLAIQSFRAILWNTSNSLSPKQLIAQEVATVGVNGAVSFLLTAAAAVPQPTATTTLAYEVEVRMSDVHMNATISGATGTFSTSLGLKLPITPGEFDMQFDPAGSI